MSLDLLDFRGTMMVDREDRYTYICTLDNEARITKRETIGEDTCAVVSIAKHSSIHPTPTRSSHTQF